MSAEYTPTFTLRRAYALCLALSLGAAISLGITRFSYALLLYEMKQDLRWTYALAGGMNTANAVGYLVGALSSPFILRRCSASVLLGFSAIFACVLMALPGWMSTSAPLMLQRLLAGVISAWMFVAGGILAARLGGLYPQRSGWLIGLYYGGTGLGIVLSALMVPRIFDWVLASGSHSAFGIQVPNWAYGWWSLAIACAVATVPLGLACWALRTQEHASPPPMSSITTAQRFRWQAFAFALASYALFGLGYIGYMTFVIALLREQQVPNAQITLFYLLLGLAVVASSWLWANLLTHYKDGRPMALLNALLGVATVLPALTSIWMVLLFSGILFGLVFLSVVASTTALVRHNLPADQWATGISAFTMTFAFGQIVGPAVVGWIADAHTQAAGGLGQGLLFSAFALWLGSLLAWQQKALPAPNRLAAGR